MSVQPLESGATLWIVMTGNPVDGFEYHGPYGTKGEAEFDYEQDEDPYWIAPMRYRRGYHVGALQIGTP